jgi:hypothetical protein
MNINSMKMNNTFKVIITFILAVILISCNDEFEGEIVRDSLAEIPVTFDGATTNGFNPYYTVSYGTGTTQFSIQLRIPDDSPLKIKEVTNIVAGTTAINAASLNAATGKYIDSPVTVSGNTYTLTTSITEFNTKVTGATRITAAPAAGAFTERAFMIKLTMDDNSIIVPIQVRIRVTP